MIFIAADHAGFDLKNILVKHIRADGHEITDLGANSLDPSDDYPEFAAHVALEVVKDPKNNLGIVICRNGVGVCMTANKFKGARCALSWRKDHAISSRKDDDANILALPADYIRETDALEVTDAWLAAPFSNSDRHNKRLAMLEELGSK